MKTRTVPYFHDLQTLGYIQGVTIKNALSDETCCHYFGGIPYALPPIGPYRWKKPRPQPVNYQYGTTSSPGCFSQSTKVCPQYAPHTQPDTKSIDEDCLQANLWLPAGDAPSDGWPVYFYIRLVKLLFLYIKYF